MRATLVALLLVALAAGGCGDDTTEPAAPTTAPATSGPVEASEPTTVPPTTVPVTVAPTTSVVPVDVGVGYTAQPDGVPWPTEEWARGTLDDDVDGEALQVLLDQALREVDGPWGHIQAVLVVENGELVVEDYGREWTADQVHQSFSIAKTVTHAAAGILHADGVIDAFGPVGAPEWPEGDERAAITYDQLLRMSSGLEWNELLNSLDDGDGVTAASAQATRPLDHEIDTFWNYSTGSTAIIGRALGDAVGTGDAFTAWMHERLFQPIGIETVELEFDPSDYWLAGTGANMSAEDFARFGLLYLRDGVWDGTRVLPEGWVDYGRRPGPDPGYGASLWVGDWYSPGSYSAEGILGQNIIMVPDADVVLVVLSQNPDGTLTDRLSVELIELLRGDLAV